MMDTFFAKLDGVASHQFSNVKGRRSGGLRKNFGM